MNANDQFFARDAHVDNAAIAPLPASRKIFVTGSRADIRVPMREIAQADTPASFGAEENPPIDIAIAKMAVFMIANYTAGVSPGLGVPRRVLSDEH